jgi:hypothetical protein
MNVHMKNSYPGGGTQMRGELQSEIIMHVNQKVIFIPELHMGTC